MQLLLILLTTAHGILRQRADTLASKAQLHDVRHGRSSKHPG